MIPFLPPRTPEQHQAEVEWLARQPRWVVRAYAGFYATGFIASVVVVAWATWTHFWG